MNSDIYPIILSILLIGILLRDLNKIMNKNYKIISKDTIKWFVYTMKLLICILALLLLIAISIQSSYAIIVITICIAIIWCALTIIFKL